MQARLDQLMEANALLKRQAANKKNSRRKKAKRAAERQSAGEAGDSADQGSASPDQQEVEEEGFIESRLEVHASASCEEDDDDVLARWDAEEALRVQQRGSTAKRAPAPRTKLKRGPLSSESKRSCSESEEEEEGKEDESDADSLSSWSRASSKERAYMKEKRLRDPVAERFDQEKREGLCANYRRNSHRIGAPLRAKLVCV